MTDQTRANAALPPILPPTLTPDGEARREEILAELLRAQSRTRRRREARAGVLFAILLFVFAIPAARTFLSAQHPSAPAAPTAQTSPQTPRPPVLSRSLIQIVSNRTINPTIPFASPAPRPGFTTVSTADFPSLLDRIQCNDAELLGALARSGRPCYILRTRGRTTLVCPARTDEARPTG